MWDVWAFKVINDVGIYIYSHTQLHYVNGTNEDRTYLLADCLYIIKKLMCF